MGDLGCAPEVRQSRPSIDNGRLGSAPKVRQSRPGVKTGLPGQRLPLLRQNGPTNGPSAPEPPSPQRIQMGCNRGLLALKRVKKAPGPSGPEPPPKMVQKIKSGPEPPLSILLQEIGTFEG